MPILMVITGFLWLGAKAVSVWPSGLTQIAQITALGGVVMLSWQYVLATRLPFLERWYWGFDRMYRYHHKLGIFALTLLAIHPTLMVLTRWWYGGWPVAASFIFDWSFWPILAGKLALLMFAILIVLAVLKLKYRQWKQIHQLMGWPLLFVLIHVATIYSDVADFEPLRWWVLGWIVVAIAAYTYKEIWVNMLVNKLPYRIVKISSRGALTEVWLRAQKMHLAFMPGQYANFRFALGKNKWSEWFPFTISSTPDDELLRISVKALGDFTQKMGGLRLKSKVEIDKPHGLMPEEFFVDRDVVVIGAGIGITPFLSMAKFETAYPREREIDIFYIASDKTELYYNKEIGSLAAENKNITHTACLTKKGRPELGDLLAKVGSWQKAKYLLCGPTAMMRGMKKQLVDRGVKPGMVFFEDFSYK